MPSVQGLPTFERLATLFRTTLVKKILILRHKKTFIAKGFS